MGEKGFLRSVQNDLFGTDSAGKNKISITEDESGDYLAFTDEADPIFLPREMMEWMSEREESESFIKKLQRGFKKIV